MSDALATPVHSASGGELAPEAVELLAAYDAFDLARRHMVECQERLREVVDRVLGVCAGQEAAPTGVSAARTGGRG